VSIYTALVAVSLPLGFWIGTRARNRTHLVNLSRRRTEPPAALLQSHTSKISNPETGNGVGGRPIVNDNSTSLRVDATDSCKMVGRNFSDVYLSFIQSLLSYYRCLSFGRIWGCRLERLQLSKHFILFHIHINSV
jgi:hypothetical protein